MDDNMFPPMFNVNQNREQRRHPNIGISKHKLNRQHNVIIAEQKRIAARRKSK